VCWIISATATFSTVLKLNIPRFMDKKYRDFDDEKGSCGSSSSASGGQFYVKKYERTIATSMRILYILLQL